MTNWPADIDPKSGMRLPIPERETLDDAGKKAYDRAFAPGASIAGAQGLRASSSTARRRRRWPRA